MEPAEIWKQAAKQVLSGKSPVILRNLTGQESFLAQLEEVQNRPGHGGVSLWEENGKRWCSQQLFPRQRLVLCGAGHIAVPVCKLALMLDFSVTVLDDRAEYATPERFPGAQVLTGNFSEIIRTLSSSGEKLWFVIVTRGHAADRDCLKAALKSPFSYIGMIGSRNKVAKTMEALQQEGISPALLTQVHAPIGLSIGAVTPEEIAVSIAAQLIEVRSGLKLGAYLGNDVLESLKSGQGKAVITVLSKKGSGPRDAGAVMVLKKDLTLCGTVGGGLLEREAAEAAGQLMPGEMKQTICQINNQTAADSGMICGGEVLLLLESLEKKEETCD